MKSLLILAEVSTPTLAPGLEHFLMLGAVLFVCGLLALMTKRHPLGMLMGVELILSSATINLVAFAYFNPVFEVEGLVFALYVLVLGAAQAAVGVAITILFSRHHAAADVDQAQELKG